MKQTLTILSIALLHLIYALPIPLFGLPAPQTITIRFNTPTEDTFTRSIPLSKDITTDTEMANMKISSIMVPPQITCNFSRSTGGVIVGGSGPEVKVPHLVQVVPPEVLSHVQCWPA
ncbi:hypothetical protein GLAREA_09172 [Glarea lozoyensis ATCC 20868]|uniref:Uncharacterized protein n=1 Tax=Glarea lozoyensis (strain ATCC 20868 / MF5171) TaxID=1116229 RepID=S3DIL9_GLAL2|nr:uncharacterized protein GLAREA_09172 [Glarea lozoyensis ATCC 20868]EPE37009.1 hypothetical protein GLAREA_09172 [Glarea lozoyensis ATCC 20868]